MLANGGQLVTPYLVSDVEQPGAKGSPRVVLRSFAPPPPRSARRRPEALAAVRDGLYAATHSANGTSAGVFGSYPVSISGKTGHRGEGRAAARLSGRPPRGPVLVVRLGTVGLGELVVCALIENGGHGSSAAAPAALRVFEQFFNVEAPQATLVDTD